MIRAEALCDFARKRRLGNFVGVETDRERRDARARRGRCCDDDARVDAARKKEAERHVRDHLLCDGCTDQCTQLLARGFERRIPRRIRYGDAPIAARRPQNARSRRIHELVRRRQLEAALVERFRRRHVAVAQEVVAGAGVDLEVACRQRLLERLELGSERKTAAVVVVIERLDARAVAVEPELLLARIPDGDREHAVDPVDEVGAPLEVRVQGDFGVGVGLEHVAALDQGPAQLAVAVDLAVEDDPTSRRRGRASVGSRRGAGR